MMARRVISVVIIALLGIASVAMASSVQRFNTDSLLRVLDGIVENDRHIEENLQHSIATCRSELRLAENDSVRFGVLGCMFHLYRKYRLDSALYYARLRADVARQMGNRDSISEALMNVADALKGVGRFQDGLAVLRGLPNDEYVKASNYYYYLLHSITLSLYNEYSDAEQDEYYRKLLRSYRDDLPERLPLSRQKEFKNIKNLVILQAMRLGDDIQEEAESLSERAGPDPIPEASTHTGWASQDRYRSAAQRNAVQLLRHLGNLFREQAPVSAMPAPRLVDQKLRRKIQEKKKALGLKQGGPEMR